MNGFWAILIIAAIVGGAGAVFNVLAVWAALGVLFFGGAALLGWWGRAPQRKADKLASRQKMEAECRALVAEILEDRAHS